MTPPTSHPPPRNEHEMAMSLARIEGMLSAQLPAIQESVKANDVALKAHVAAAETRRDGLHSRINALTSKTDRQGERLEDVEERQAGQLGRVAQFVAIAGGAIGALSFILPAILQSS